MKKLGLKQRYRLVNPQGKPTFIKWGARRRMIPLLTTNFTLTWKYNKKVIEVTNV